MKSRKKKEKFKDTSALVSHITAEVSKQILTDDVWKCYGFKKRPTYNRFQTIIFRKNWELENFLIKEILSMLLVDVVNGIKASRKAHSTKLQVALGVIDKYIATTQETIDPDYLLDNLLYIYENRLSMDKSEIHALIMFRAKGKLKRKDFERFMDGTKNLLQYLPNGDFLLESAYIKRIVNGSFKRKKMNLSMSDKECEKYSALIKEKILQA